MNYVSEREFISHLIMGEIFSLPFPRLFFKKKRRVRSNQSLLHKDLARYIWLPPILKLESHSLIYPLHVYSPPSWYMESHKHFSLARYGKKCGKKEIILSLWAQKNYIRFLFNEKTSDGVAFFQCSFLDACAWDIVKKKNVFLYLKTLVFSEKDAHGFRENHARSLRAQATREVK